MKTKADDPINPIRIPTMRDRDACEKITDGESLKMMLRRGKGLSAVELTTRSLQILRDEKEPAQNRVFAMQSLARSRPVAGLEDALIRIAAKKDPVLSFPALKTLGLTGTPKTFQALSDLGRLPLKSMERQKDFAMLLIGYRHQLPGAEKILERMLKELPQAPKNRMELPLKLQAVSPAEAGALLGKLAESEPQAELDLSRKSAFQLQAGRHQFYFYFNNRLENPASWGEVLAKKQVIGQLFRKEHGAEAIAQHYIGLSTPNKDGLQLSFFRKNGELFLLAQVSYDKAKKAFIVTNTREEGAKDAGKSELRLDPTADTISLRLSYVRRQKKRSSADIPPEPIDTRKSERE